MSGVLCTPRGFHRPGAPAILMRVRSTDETTRCTTARDQMSVCLLIALHVTVMECGDGANRHSKLLTIGMMFAGTNDRPNDWPPYLGNSLAKRTNSSPLKSAIDALNLRRSATSVTRMLRTSPTRSRAGFVRFCMQKATTKERKAPTIFIPKS